MTNHHTDATIELDDFLADEAEVDRPPVVVAGLLNGKEVYTFCPPGTTLEKAEEVYLPKGAIQARLLTPEEIAEAFPDEQNEP